ncbi:MAG TPA: right-handed parallel beta-helix repeat-containing protein [Phycisphaerae bacterium]|nr:right-handed parallel beta-helix repeat-containing protein [Phycisphaerae bacterium]
MRKLKWLIVPAALVLVAGTTWADRPAIVSPFGGETVLFDDSTGGGVILGSFGRGVQGGADHIVDQQCLDGGWGWPHDDCTTTYNNITAPICLGLLQAYEMTGDSSHLTSATNGGDFDLTFQYTNLEARFGSFTPFFMYKLTAANGDSTYSDFAATEFFDELTAGTYGPGELDTMGYLDGHKAARSGALINIRPWDMQYMPWIAGQIGNSTSGPSDAVDQQTRFLEDSVLDGLNTLDDSLTNPATDIGDLIGLAGGVHGLALNGTTSFTALTAPNFSAIQDISTLCALADVLAGYQNGDGSWYWATNLASPAEGDKDTQTTAYAVMALLAADVHCTDYSDEIAAGREWLWSMQDADGGFDSYPDGTHNTEVEGEVLTAMTPPEEVWVDDGYCDGCANGGHAWGYDAFDNIQDGINAVAGSTVNVAAGTYNEDVTIGKSLTLNGAQVGVDARGRSASESEIVGVVVVTSAATNVVFDGLKLTSPTRAFTPRGFNLRVESENSTIKNCIFVAEENAGHTYSGYLDFGGITNTTVERNSFSGHLDPTQEPNVIMLGITGAGTVTVTHNEMHNVGGGGGVGIMCSNDSAVINIEDNEFDNTGDGVWIWTLAPQTFSVSITGNDIHNCAKKGVKVVGSSVGTVAIHYNRIYDNAEEGVFNSVAGLTVDAENNWWGDATGPEDLLGTNEADSPTCYDPLTMKNADGLGDEVSDLYVDYCPWLLGAGGLILEAADCQDDAYDATGYQIEVKLWMRDLTQNVTGFQAFLEYETAKLTYNAGLSSYNDSAFEDHLTTMLSAEYAGGKLQLDGSTYTPKNADMLLATLVFDVDTECVTTGVDFDLSAAFDSELSYEGEPVPTALVDSPDVYLDDTDPVIGAITMNNANITTDCSVDLPVSATVTDNCAILASAVTVVGTITTGNASVDDSSITITQTDGQTVTIGGYVTVYDLTSCPATVRVTINGADECANPATQATKDADVNDAVDPWFAGGTFPADEDQNADAGLCTAVLVPAIVPPTGQDNCDTDPLVEYKRDDRGNWNEGLTDAYDAGDTVITWRVTDDCDLTYSQDQTITVYAVNDVVGVVVELEDVNANDWDDSGSVTRCIEFTAKNGTDCAMPVSVEVVFSGALPAIGTAPTFEVECGDWTELCAKDEQHTLYDTQSLKAPGTVYQTTVALNLLAGDTDNDSDVDINDVTWLIYQYGQPAEDGGCLWDGTRDADFSNNGIVYSEDYTILSYYWLNSTECACTKGFGGERTAVKLSGDELKSLPADVVAAVDLNADGVIDHRDVRLFEQSHGLPDTLSEIIRATAEKAQPLGVDRMRRP